MNMMRSVVIIGGSVVVGLGLIVLWATVSRPPASERTPIVYVEEAAEAEHWIELDVPAVSTAENFIGHQTRIVSGRVRNAGDRPLRSVELVLEFEDFEGETVHEFAGEALRASLPAGESRGYEFRFEELPAGWNYSIPRVRVRRVGY